MALIENTKTEKTEVLIPDSKREEMLEVAEIYDTCKFKLYTPNGACEDVINAFGKTKTAATAEEYSKPGRTQKIWKYLCRKRGMRESNLLFDFQSFSDRYAFCTEMRVNILCRPIFGKNTIFC